MLSNANIQVVYSSGDTEPIEFFFDALTESDRLDLGLGYFSSSSFRALSLGFAYFICQGGQMRIIINDVLSHQDTEAIEKGMCANPDELIEQFINDDIFKLEETLSRSDKHFFNCLSWLIANNKLKIIAITPSNSSAGIAHHKFGIFKDKEGNRVAFNRSTNFSSTALVNNLESITCSKSWTQERSEIARIEHFENLFENIWQGTFKNVRVIKIDKIHSSIREKFPVANLEDLLVEEERLIYQTIQSPSISESFKNKILVLKDKINEQLASEAEKPISSPPFAIPVKLHTYQKSAIAAWFENNNIGLFEMATGTGKTITALAATVELLKRDKRLIVVIACPFIHLVEQWCDEAKRFGFRAILVAEAGKKWQPILSRELQLFARKVIDLVVIATTNASLSSTFFQSLMQDFWSDSVFIADEAHYLGSANLRKLLPYNSKYRIGLTATPERYFDDIGTNQLYDFFQKTIFSLPLKEAIGTYLTNYYYFPIPVEMTDAEFAEYCAISRQIEKLSSYHSDKYDDRIEKLLIKRARIQNNSESKVNWTVNNIPDVVNMTHTLFYVGDKIFDRVKRIIGVDKKVHIHEFTGEQTRVERKNILERFSKGDLEALIAMKCLDEGVDIPPTRTAYFLASSGNPKEFIQRRGRVLRKFEGKEFARIYDLISIPPLRFIMDAKSGDSYNAVRGAFRKEYKRVKEFSSLALNKHTSLDSIFDIAAYLGVLGE